MCGIAGILFFDTHKPCRAEQLRAMADSIIHRGPDEEGIYMNAPACSIGLAFRRLSIIDLAGSHQPMSSADGQHTIVFNGEIYNYQELRAELLKAGVQCRTAGDTEVVLQLYRMHGDACVDHLRGMFAFAIWDQPRQRLFAARDRMGKKPFFYTRQKDCFIFASEPKAIFASGEAPRQWDDIALYHYFTYASIPAPQSGYAEVRKLPAAHTLIVENGRVSIQRYWSFTVRPDNIRSYADWQAELKHLLTDAVRMRLMSEVPLGVFLSGGIDSSLLTALMAEIGHRPIKTFSMGFHEPKYNETQYARLVAERYQTEHYEEIVEPDAVELLPSLARHYDEPYADASAIPTFLLSRMTRRHVTVALSGEGGDELFGGYDRYYAMQLADRLQWMPAGLRRVLFGGLAGLIPAAVEYKTHRTRLKKLLQGLSGDPVEGYIRWFAVFQPAQLTEICHADFLQQVATVDPWQNYRAAFRECGAGDLPARAAYVDATNYLPNDLLYKLDIASMAHSLEGRTPFMDHRLVEFAFTLPTQFKIKGRTNKIILRDTFGHLIPAPILQRRKMGFGVPLSAWFRGRMKDYLQDVLFDPRTLARGIYREAGLRQFVHRHVTGQADYGPQLWALLFAEIWMRECLDRPTGAKP